MSATFRCLIALGLITASLPLVTHASEARSQVFGTDPSSAWQQAQRQQRPMLLFITTNQCVYCTRMKQVTYSDERVLSDIRASFVATSVKSSEQLPIVEQLGVRIFPTTAIISPDGRVLKTIAGYVGPQSLRATLRDAVDQVQK